MSGCGRRSNDNHDEHALSLCLFFFCLLWRDSVAREAYWGNGAVGIVVSRLEACGDLPGLAGWVGGDVKAPTFWLEINGLAE